MWTMEDVLSELRERGEEEEDNYYNYNEKGRNNNKNNSNNNGLPPGFRFHPTDEELITYYLASKVFYNRTVSTPVHIAEVDLNRCEPWDLPERAKMGEKEWYLYSLRDRKYPTGLRTNRATSSGYWKATGKDRQVNAGSGIGDGLSSSGGMLIGMKKTLVFYQGRAPRGIKTRWVMHEYRLDGHFSSFRLSSKEEWVICRIFHKNGGEKKTTFHPPPPPPPLPPLSPFLRHLPPLLDVPTTTTATSSTSTIQSLEFCNRKPRNNINNNNHYHSDSNFLLQSLLSNPLPNFSSLTDAPTTEFAASSAFPTTTPAAATSIGHHTPPPPFLFNPLSSRASKQNKNMQQQQQLMYHHNPFGFSETDNQCRDNENEDDNDNDDDVAVNFHMSSSSVDALDRLIYPSHHMNFAAESWPCH